MIKRQFGFTKVRYRGLAKNTARLKMLCVGQCVGGAPPFDGDGRIGVLEMSEWRPKQAIQGEDHPDISQF